jgi:outer membrane protein assembly factor BamB
MKGKSNIVKTSLLFVACLFSLALTTGATDLKTDPITTKPAGDYAIARLELPAGLDGKPQRLLLGLRDGKLANLWFVAPQSGDQRIHIEDATLTRDGAKLAGKAHLRVNKTSGWLTLDLNLADGKLAGEYTLDMTGTPFKSSGKGNVTGTFAAQPPPTDALPPNGSWTSFWGTTLDMAAGPQPALVTDLAQARPVWRSEAYVLTGYGNAPDSRYFTRAMASGNGGGGSSPVIADGTVYINFFTPTTQMEPSLKGNPFWERTFKSPEHFQEEMTKAKANAREIAWVQNHFRPVADDVVVAIDAATGATKWTTVLPLRSLNHQTHKHRGVSPVPLVVGDTIYVPNLVGRLFALDRATGKVKWERPTFDAAKLITQAGSGPANPSPLFMGGHIIWGGSVVSGLDPATGQQKWRTELGHGGYLTPWTHAGKQRLVSIYGHPGKTVACIDPVDGKILWKQETPLFAGAPLSAVIAGDMLLAGVLLPKGSKDLPYYEGWKLSETGLTKVWQDTGLPPDENVPVTVLDGRAYLLGRQMIRCLDVATGKMLVERKFANNQGPGSNPWLGVVADRLLLLPEGQHGTADLVFLDKDLKKLGPLWRPWNTTTTAYNSQPIIYPVVDGRLFIRGGDGIYCYDLRRP